jgi:hypothetical protein
MCLPVLVPVAKFLPLNDVVQVPGGEEDPLLPAGVRVDGVLLNIAHIPYHQNFESGPAKPSAQTCFKLQYCFAIVS